MDTAIKLCGGYNIIDDAAVQFPTISIEVLLKRNPDVILTSLADNAHQNQPTAKIYWQQWPTLNAVKKNQLFVIDSDHITRPALRILQGLEQICQHLDLVRKNKEQSTSLTLKE